MKSLIRVGWAILGVLSFLAAAVIPQSASAETNALKLIVQVDSTSIVLPGTGAAVSVNVTNLSDSIASFAMRLRLENNENVHFAIDSVGFDGSDSIYFAKIDISSARIRGWESLEAIVTRDSIEEMLSVSGSCDDGFVPTMTPLAPGSGTLVDIYFELGSDFPLSLCNSLLSPLRLIDSATSFYSPSGELIGFDCTAIDSIDANCVLDSAEALYLDGAITSWCCLWNDEMHQCGDCDANGMINISDAVCIISWIFAWSGPDTKPPCMRFANGDGLVSISDVVYLINYIFADRPSPWCE